MLVKLTDCRNYSVFFLGLISVWLLFFSIRLITGNYLKRSVTRYFQIKLCHKNRCILTFELYWCFTERITTTPASKSGQRTLRPTPRTTRATVTPGKTYTPHIKCSCGGKNLVDES
jgi:hypothetical protein